MSTGASSSPEFTSNDHMLAAINTSLRQAFGVSFAIWLRKEGWSRWNASENSGGSHATKQIGPETVEQFEEAIEREAPSIRSQSESNYLVAIPIVGVSDFPMVAMATVAMTSEDLMQKVADSFLREFRQWQKLQENNQELESYAEQISRDFEELAYLQGLAGHLELCDISRPVVDVAETILPMLRDLVHARSLLFVSAVPQRDDDGNTCCVVGRPGVCIGEKVLDDAVCQRLVQQFQDRAAEQPVVRNCAAVRSFKSDFPGLESFLLTRVAKDGSCCGWLLAVNRKREGDGQADLNNYPTDGLNDHEFGTIEAGLMSAAAVMLATHAHNLEVFEEKKGLLIGIVRALINAVDAKDSYTCGHSDRVALIARRLGEELQLDRQAIEQLYLAGLLHDIGKIGVPDYVLQKPGRLEDHEFAQIQQHPTRGRSILKDIEHLSYVVPSVLHHHEHYDGTGYPDGLAKEEIPLAARIVAIADSYDAMSSHRPYREPMPEEKIIEILCTGAGTQWDGHIMDAFFSALPDIREICTEAEKHTQNILGTDRGASGVNKDATKDSISAAVNTMQAE